MRIRKARIVLVASLAVLAASLSGCGRNKLVDRVDFSVADNLESIRVSLIFQRNVETDLALSVPLKDYGYLFLNPFTPTEPFEVGFMLNTSVVNEQDYVRLTPTRFLPNGVPIGLEHPLVEVRAPEGEASKVQVYGYVDVLKGSWLGTAALFSFVDDRYFPEGLALSQSFLRDGEKRPRAIASIFGPKLDPDGNLDRPGGIALFANVKALIGKMQAEQALGRKLALYPAGEMSVTGSNAEYYRRNRRELLKLQDQFLEGLASQ